MSILTLKAPTLAPALSTAKDYVFEESLPRYQPVQLYPSPWKPVSHAHKGSPKSVSQTALGPQEGEQATPTAENKKRKLLLTNAEKLIEQL